MNLIQAVIENATQELVRISVQLQLFNDLDMKTMKSAEPDQYIQAIKDHILHIVNDLDGIEFGAEPDFSLLDSVTDAMKAEQAKTARCNGVAIVPPCVPGKTCRPE